jgi:hypothetical protein
MQEKATFIGTVEDVEGFQARVLLADETSLGLTFVDGYGYRVGQVGSFVRIPLGYDDIFGLISQVGASASPENENDESGNGSRWMTIQLIGEAERSGYLRRGLSQFPSVGDEVHIVTEDELSRIYDRPDSQEHIRIGTVVGSDRIPSLVNINKLVTRHSAIVGNTGAGKSTTVSGLLHRITSASNIVSPRVLVLDIHGEYANSMREIASVFTVNSNPRKDEEELYIPYWALNFQELLSVSFGSLNNESDRRQLMEEVLQKKRESVSQMDHVDINKDEIDVDTPIPFSIHKLWFDLHRLVISTHLETGDQGFDTIAYRRDDEGNPVDKGDAMDVRPPETLPQNNSADADPKVWLSQSPLNVRRQLGSLASRLRDSRYDFLFKPGEWLPDEDGIPNRDLDGLLKNWLGNDEGITILNLSGMPPEVLDTMVGALLRIIYDSLFWAQNIPEGGRERPLLLVLEEAHSYVGDSSDGSAASSVQRIAKEGRKYGIGLMLVSQRPTEIDNTILSQCGTMFAMRLSNSRDQSKVVSSLSDNLEGILNMLPVLRTGEAIVVGEAVRLPTRTHVTPPPEQYRPESRDPLVYSPNIPGGWNQPRVDPNYGEVLELWRRQKTKSLQEKDLDQEENS